MLKLKLLMNFNFFKNYSLQFGIVFFSILITFLTNFFLAKYLSILEFSFFSQAMALGSIMLIVFDFGFKSLIFRENIKKETQINFLNIATYNSFIIFLFILIISFFVDTFPNIQIILLCFFILNLIFFKSYKYKAEGNFFLDFKINFILRILGFIFFLIQIFYFKFYDSGNYFNFWLISLTICCIFFYYKDITIRKKKIDKKIIKTVLTFFFIDLLIVIYFKSDILLLTYFKIDPIYIANYNIAHKVFEFPMAFFAPLCFLLYRDSRIFFNKHKFVSKNYNTIFLILISGILYFLITFFFYDNVIIYLFDQKFIQSITMVKYMSVTIIFMFLNCYLILILYSINMEKMVLNSVFLMTVLNVLFNVIFIQYYGYIAVIYSFIFTEFFLSIILIFKYLKIINKLYENRI